MKASILFISFFVVIFINVSLHSVPPPIPNLADWEAHMISTKASTVTTAQPGAISHSGCLPAGSDGDGCDVVDEAYLWYYDGSRVMRQIAGYTGNNAWLGAAEECRAYYSAYLNCSTVNHYVDGWRNFGKGLYHDWIYDANASSKASVILMAKNGKFSQGSKTAQLSGWLVSASSVDISREIAYAIHDYHIARDLGDAAFTARDPYLDLAFFQLDTWKTYLEGYPGSVYPGEPGAKYQPFMFALTAEALIGVYRRADTTQADKDKIFTKIKDVAALTYDKLYRDANHTFIANTGYGLDQYWPAINLLIAPLYAWLWHETGDAYWLNSGDKIWSDGVVYGWAEVWGGKQFSQNYRWSFDYVTWRSTDPVTVQPPATGGGEPSVSDPFPSLVNYPNPFRILPGSSAKISGLTGNCTVELFNNAGVKVRTLLEYPNYGFVAWDGKNDSGDIIAGGIYTYIARNQNGGSKKGKIAVKK